MDSKIFEEIVNSKPLGFERSIDFTVRKPHHAGCVLELRRKTIHFDNNSKSQNAIIVSLGPHTFRYCLAHSLQNIPSVKSKFRSNTLYGRTMGKLAECAVGRLLNQIIWFELRPPDVTDGCDLFFQERKIDVKSDLKWHDDLGLKVQETQIKKDDYIHCLLIKPSHNDIENHYVEFAILGCASRKELMKKENGKYKYLRDARRSEFGAKNFEIPCGDLSSMDTYLNHYGVTF